MDHKAKLNFQLQSVYEDGTREEPEIKKLEDIDCDWKMGRREFLIATTLGLAFLSGCVPEKSKQNTTITPTPTASPIPTIESTPTPTQTPTPTEALTPTSTPTKKSTPTPKPTKSPTATPNPTKVPTPTPTKPVTPRPTLPTPTYKPPTCTIIGGGTYCTCNKICTCIPIK